MSFIVAPDFPIRAITWTLDRPSQSNTSAWTGTRIAVTNPWHGKWTAHVELATFQDESKFRIIRSFFARCRGTLNTFRLYATAGPQNVNGAVTVASAAAAGATTMTTSGGVSPLLDGQFLTVNGQLCCCIADQSGSTINFEPPLRQTATAGTIVVTSRPYALVYLSSSSFAWQIASWRQFGLTFDVNEAILEADGTAPETVAPNLAALTFSSTAFTSGDTGAIIGATAGSTITSSGLPTGLTINGPARTWAFVGSPGSGGSFTLIETLAGYGNSPNSSTINYTRPIAGGAPPPVGQFLFNASAQSGELILLEDI